MRRINIITTLLILLSSSFAKAQVYDSLNMSQLSNWFNPNEPLATAYNIKYNGLWGWVDGQGNEYAILGASSGTYFINVTNPAAPYMCDSVHGRRSNCIWREIKTYQNYCYMVSDDQAPNSLQIVDMSYLPDSVHVVYDSNVLFERCHTIYVDGDKLYGGGLHGGSVGTVGMAVFSLANPASPVLLRTLNQDYASPTYAHDMYVRHDTIYASCGYDGLYIYQLLPNNHFSYINSLTTYVDQGYNHSSALSEDGHTLVMTDEVPVGLDVKVVDVSNLGNLSVPAHFNSHPDATPHNPFIKGNLAFIAYYMDGLQVYDISNPASPVRVGYYDTYWQNPAGTYPSPGYAGAWGAYPWLPSGNILVSDMQNGLFVIDASGLTGISNASANSSFIVQPNPVVKGNDLLIRLKKPVNTASLFINDISGRVIFNQTVTGEKLSIYTGAMIAGIYAISIVSDGEITSSRFIVVE